MIRTDSLTPYTPLPPSAIMAPLSRRQKLIMAVGGALFGNTPARTQSKVVVLAGLKAWIMLIREHTGLQVLKASHLAISVSPIGSGFSPLNQIAPLHQIVYHCT